MGRGANSRSGLLQDAPTQTVPRNATFNSPAASMAALTTRQQQTIEFIEHVLNSSAAPSELLAAEAAYNQSRIQAADTWDLFRETSPKMTVAWQQTIKKQSSYAATISKEQRAALEYYCGSGWKVLNSYLRLQQPLTAEATRHNQELNKLFTELPVLSENLLVSRGIDKREAEELGYKPEDIEQVYKQAKIVERGYLSAGANLLRLGADQEQISMLIELPAGSKALAIPAFNTWSESQEVLLPPGSSFQVKQRLEHDEGGETLFARLNI